FPIGTEGARLGVSYDRGKLAIIDGPFVQLDVEGKSQSGSLNYTNPVFIDETWIVQASLAGSYGKSETTNSDVKVTDDVVKDITPGLSIQYTGDGVSAVVSPTLAFVNSKSNIFDESRNVMLFKGTASAYIDLPDGFSVSSEGSWQMTGSRLIPGSQLFQIGGPTTVRGYPSGAAAGDEGYLFNLEVYKDMSDVLDGLNTFAFLDHGAVYATFPRKRMATSIGVGLDIEVASMVRLEATIAKPFNEVVPDQSEVQVYGRLSITPEW
ncbi:MAG: BamA/TamA family outer membrane protein, partial [Pseudomonadota bacterium]